ncbi:MAG: 4a-hydroxytetrahydrobiopterin dehydratase [Leptospiraceae bacterium]|nr:4a-hydroxytetrahydrobiopterin dehydratase [Leptospiraceae bacterium]
MKIFSDIEVLQNIPLFLPEWHYDRENISREYLFSSYMSSIEFVNEIAKLAESIDHHPLIHIFWRKVVVQIHTHSVKSVTSLDFELATNMDKVFNSF